MLYSLSRLMLFAALLPVVSYAAEASSPAPIVGVSSASIAGQFVQVVMALGLVLGLIVAAAWLMRRFSALPMASGSRLRVVSGVMVGPKERVVVVEIEETWLVVGVTAGSVNKLYELPKPPQPVVPAVPAMPAFAERLAKVLARKS